MLIRRAVAEDAQRLSDLALAAKAFWGYSEPQIRAWRGELTLTPQRLEAQPAFVAQDDGLVGFYTLCIAHGACELDNLWVAPSRIGSGCGRALLSHAVATARRLGLREILIDADPHAERFYLRCGAVRRGAVPAPIAGAPDRVRPQLVLDVVSSDLPA